MIAFEPIGHVRTGGIAKFSRPHQPDAEAEEVNRIELLPGRQFELALDDLDGFSHIWLVWWFDRNSTWRPRVLAPRGPAKRRGVFATRSPHRPNPVGLTCVRLHRVEGLTLEVGPLDLLDGTPILDIKPYLTTVDCHPEASLGWLDEVQAMEAEPAAFNIVVSERAQEQLDWLREKWGIDFTERAFGILARDPSPHRTRRILQMGDRLRMACGPWRLFFRVSGQVVEVLEVERGYADEALLAPGFEKIIDRDAQLDFGAWKADQSL